MRQRQYLIWTVAPETDPEPEPDADKIPLGRDIIPRVDETPRSNERSPIHVQLQESRKTYMSILLQDPGDGFGVTTVQVVDALLTLRLSPFIPKRQQKLAQQAYNKAVKWVIARPPIGVYGGGNSKFSFQFDFGDPMNNWRFDIDIFAVHHLKR